MGIVCRGVGWIPKRLLPRLELPRGCELDIGEEVLSDAWNPSLGGDAAIPERLRFIVEGVEDVTRISGGRCRFDIMISSAFRFGA